QSDAVEPEQAAGRYLRQEAGKPFNLGRLPLLRAKLLCLSKDEHILAISMPHIICDGWSNGIFVRELTKLYQAFCAGQSSPLPEPKTQYADFAHWQQEWLQTAQFDSALAYWREQLAGELPILELPADAMAPRGPVSKAETETLSIPKE